MPREFSTIVGNEESVHEILTKLKEILINFHPIYFTPFIKHKSSIHLALTLTYLYGVLISFRVMSQPFALVRIP